MTLMTQVTVITNSCAKLIRKEGNNKTLVRANDWSTVVVHSQCTNITQVSGNGDLKPSNEMDQCST